jgi:hypothetical protein
MGGSDIPGFSGAGKTTSCVALIRRGFGFLGDDRPILRYDKTGGLELLSFPEPIDVTDYTIQLFPELKNYTLLMDNRNLRKKSFNAEALYPGSTRTSCVPRIILFPEISANGKSSLEIFPKSEALKNFLPHSLLAFDKEIARKHFDIIFDLIQTTDCYKAKLAQICNIFPTWLNLYSNVPTKEQHFVLSLLKASLGYESWEGTESALSKTLDWAKVARMISYHGILPLLFNALSQNKNISLPQKITECLFREFISNSALGLLFEKALKNIVTHFKQNNLCFAINKGWGSPRWHILNPS